MKPWPKALLTATALAGLVCLTFAKAVKNNVGQPLPELKLTFVGDKPDLAGKPLLLEFWATWCEPCRENIPHLNELWKTYKDKGLIMIGVTKEDEGVVKAFVREIPIHYFIGLDPAASLAAHFGITVIPHAMLVDKNGKVTWEGHPGTLQPGDIEALLK